MAGRFGYFATLPLPDLGAAVVEALRALDERGATGVLILSNHAGIYQGDSALDSLYAELNRRDAVAFVHPAADRSPIAGIQPSQLEFGFDATRGGQPTHQRSAGTVSQDQIRVHPQRQLRAFGGAQADQH